MEPYTNKFQTSASLAEAAAARRSLFRCFGALFVVISLVSLVSTGWVVYVVWHFIAKHW